MCYNKIMNFIPTKFEIDALRKYVEDHNIQHDTVTWFMQDPEPSASQFNETVYEVSRNLGLNILDVASDIQSTAYCAKLDAMTLYASRGCVEWVEDDEPESECDPGGKCGNAGCSCRDYVEDE